MAKVQLKRPLALRQSHAAFCFAFLFVSFVFWGGKGSGDWSLVAFEEKPLLFFSFFSFFLEGRGGPDIEMRDVQLSNKGKREVSHLPSTRKCSNPQATNPKERIGYLRCLGAPPLLLLFWGGGGGRLV